MLMKRISLFMLPLAIAASLIACSKTSTVLSDVALVENPGEKKAAYVANGKVKRGEYVVVKEEKFFGGKKFLKVQIDGVSTIGWVDATMLREGKLESATVMVDSDLYVRPNLKSDKAGKVSAGQVAFKIEEKDNFVLIQYPGKEAYIQKDKLGPADMVIRTVSLPGIGKANVSASSQFSLGEGKELEFDPRNAFDGNLQTAWSEGKTGDTGIGEYITLSFDHPIKLSEISVVNGWTKSEDIYKVNTRVAQLKVVSNLGQEVLVELNDNVMDYQTSPIDIVGSSFRFIINKVYEGKDSDTCISEIKLQGESYTPQDGERY
jgi:hypothetical protein